MFLGELKASRERERETETKKNKGVWAMQVRYSFRV